MQDIRNIAIIAHVDHGKTTLVDAMLKQSGTFSEREEVADRVMDSNDIEKERGITILAKNTAINYNNTKINIVDTPGHADFGGEVERVLKMVNGVILVVDAFEGPMPQTRFVLHKALTLHLTPILVINKVDRDGARPKEVENEVLELLIDLGATEDQLDLPVIYASAKNGIASLNIDEAGTNLIPLFETIVNTIEPPKCDVSAPLQILVSNIEYDEYMGRIAIGRIENGKIAIGDTVVICKDKDNTRSIKVSKLFTFDGLSRVPLEKSVPGDIIAVAGVEDIQIGETITDSVNPMPLPFVDIDAPTVSMTFAINDSPFAGREGQYITSRHLRERLYKELETDVSLHVEDTEDPGAFVVSGRGELHLSILIENMRRQGYELMVSKPKVIFKEIDGKKCEPIEQLFIDVPDDCIGSVMEKLGTRKAVMLNMTSGQTGYTRLEFSIPARGLIGYRGEFMTDTRGNGIMNHMFMGYEPYKGDIQTRSRGALIAFEKGKSTNYGLFNAQDRGMMFIGSGVEVYEGMVVGENSRSEDIAINVCKEKHLTNTRASGSDEALKLVPPKLLTLEEALEFITDEELVEVTPQNIRIRKRILDSRIRAKSNR